MSLSAKDYEIMTHGWHDDQWNVVQSACAIWGYLNLNIADCTACDVAKKYGFKVALIALHKKWKVR